MFGKFSAFSELNVQVFDVVNHKISNLKIIR